MPVRRRQIQYYMKLALVFLEKSKAAKIEMAALPGDGVEIVDFTSTAAKRFADRATDFVGDLSLTELLEKHNIKGITRGDDDDAEPTPAGAGEQLLFTEISDHLFGLRTGILNRENLMKLEPKQLDALKLEIESTRTEFLKLYEQARGQNSEPKKP